MNRRKEDRERLKYTRLAVSVLVVSATVMICVCAFLVQVGNAKEYRAPVMPNYYQSCRQSTRIRKPPVGYTYDNAATARCVNRRQENWRRTQMDSSIIEVNRAAADLYREQSKYIRTR